MMLDYIISVPSLIDRTSRNLGKCLQCRDSSVPELVGMSLLLGALSPLPVVRLFVPWISTHLSGRVNSMLLLPLTPSVSVL